MRIYDLAKSIGQQLNITVKSGDLADEFRTLPEFAEIHDTIKSHASSVDDRFARVMFEIYARRQREGATTPAAAPAAKPAAPKVVAPRPAGPGRPSAPAQRPAPPAPVARPAAPAPPPLRRPAAPPRPAPITPGPAGGPRPVVPIPGRRPAPIQPIGKAPAAPVVEPPPPIAPPRPKAEAPTPSAAPAAPGEQRTRPAAAPRPGKLRPSGLATELKSSSGTTGVSAAPETGRPAPGVSRIGQPTAPAAPKFSADSPFLKPPARRERPAAGGERPGADARRPGGRRIDAKEIPLSPEQLTALPEIGVMKLKPGGKRGRKPGEAERDEKAKAAAAKKGVRPSRVYGDADEFRRPIKPGAKRTKTPPDRRRDEPKVPQKVSELTLTGPVTVSEFAEKMGLPPAELIKQAFLKGKAITINQLMDFELAEELAIDNDVDLKIQLEADETDVAEYLQAEDRPEDLRPRPPVVTIMGHVDHGKTSVLDYYRKSAVAEGEYGGITQHIGAYQIKSPNGGTIVFLDTPGHEAFTAMRARGVKCTDIVVLVVAADDGVMPQTIESINHAKAAGTPLIVAINKMDLPQANPERVRQELMQHSVLSTQLGGDTEFAEISAKTGRGMDDLLEIIQLQAELLELKANPNRPAQAVVIESHTDPMRGSVATVLVQRGTLRVGQYFVVGQEHGRVRAMYDDRGRPVQATTLAQPVELIGLSGTPEVGETLLVMEDERKAREIAERREQRRRLVELGTTRHISLEGLHDRIAEGEIKDFNVILKADVQGSVEAIIQALEKLHNEEVRVRVLHSGTGSINESDVNLAMASDAVIIGFNVRPEPGANDLATREGIDLKLYRIIYELLEDVEAALVGQLKKRYQEQTLGRAEVRKVFRVSRVGTVAGCMVVSGEISRNAQARLLRDGKIVWEGRIDSLRRVKDDVARVASGYECGIGLERFQDIKEGDVIEAFALEEIPAELTRSSS
ncbi:MAG TPA: translation initiation factor IF-2 [Candidatus Sumerlaeota bacterium]|nr:translation initiation factor IF-2 [Candidatus Sumerlaeota bacterium]HOR28812.1 translation initiation factor IF-2 [Candidatus Sumerlaeota bacterium]HPK03004.1 translation initiation factor IF-2 [Candidatus Sumerlaeota bacterium]